uniref:F-box domain-containing protein n=1 Tax=Steinernema glaseri TaxID=37863 RepID=A0A1I7Z1D5_9BILA
MNSVPLAFCERVCDVLYRRGLQEAKKLSGFYGEFAQMAYDHTAHYVATVSGGVERGLCHICVNTGRQVYTLKETEAVPKKYIQDVTIYFFDEPKENLTRAIVLRFPLSFYHFEISSSSFNKAWVNLACSLKRISSVKLKRKLDDNAVQLFQKLLRRLVARQTLSRLQMYEEAGFVELFKSLVCQEQFRTLAITIINLNDNHKPRESIVVQEVLRLWPDNLEKLRGKRLTLEGDCSVGVKQLEKFTCRTERKEIGVSPYFRSFPLFCALKVCSQKECNFIDEEYRHNHTRFYKPSCVYKYEEGEEGEERHRIYIFFECARAEERRMMRKCQPANTFGCYDLGLIRNTSSLHVLFV